MINQNDSFENTENKFLQAFKQPKLSSLLKTAGIAKVISKFNSLTRSERIKAFVIDDSVIERSQSKEVELLANTYDHVFHWFVRGFTLLELG